MLRSFQNAFLFYFILFSDVVRGQTGVVRHRQEGDADQGDQEPD